MTSSEKKRLTWILILIFFFFANLIVVGVFAFNAFLGTPSHPAPAPITRPATQQ